MGAAGGCVRSVAEERLQLTFIVTIDPVKGLSLLNVLLHSLNLQTRRNFDVVFYNQTSLSESDLFARVRVRPRFNYRFFSVDRSEFLGDFPLWDLFSFHRRLIDENLVGDYFMSMHMEEWFDVDYVQNVTTVLEATGFDILLGNLCRTTLDESGIADILETRDETGFSDYVRTRRLKRAPHWTFQRLPSTVVGKLSVAKQNAQKIVDFGFRTRLVPSHNGYSQLSAHYEDLYFMKRDFARRHVVHQRQEIKVRERIRHGQKRCAIHQSIVRKTPSRARVNREDDRKIARQRLQATQESGERVAVVAAVIH